MSESTQQEKTTKPAEKKLITSSTTLRLTETALMVALSSVLAAFAVIQFPFGGSVTLFSQVPVIILAYRYGTKWGLVSGFTLSLVELMLGLNNFAYVKGMGAYLVLVLADYLIPFTLLGLGAIFKNCFKSQVPALALGSILVSLIRYICHFISGVTIWASYAGTDAFWGVVKYSAGYNGSYMLPEMLITILGVCIVGKFFNLSKEHLI